MADPNEQPVEPNSTTGGSPADAPSSPASSASADADALPVPPPAPPAVESSSNDNNDGGGGNDEDGGGGRTTSGGAREASPQPFSFNFNNLSVGDDNNNNNDGGAAPGGPEDDPPDDDAADDDQHDMMNVLPPSVVKRVETLRAIHDERDAILEEYLRERAELEQNYAAKMRPLYEKRKDVVTGKLDRDIRQQSEYAEWIEKQKGGGEVELGGGGDEGGGEEEEEGRVYDANDEGQVEGVDPAAAAADDDANVVGIPQFWVCAMGHMEAIAELLTERDVDCLEHLTDVTCDDDPDGKGFTLTFHFDTENNEYFTDATLTKRYDIPNLLLDDEPILKNVVGCDIHWNKGKDLTHREVQKKQRAKGGRKAGQIRTVTKRERTESFFHFFTPPKMPKMEDMDEDEADAVEEAFDRDYDVAQAFRSHVIPKAVLWFTGEALDEFDETMLEGAQFPGFDDDQHEEDGGGAGTGGAGNAASPFPPPAEGAGENPECKQN